MSDHNNNPKQASPLSIYSISVLEAKDSVIIEDLNSAPLCTDLGALSVDFDLSLFQAKKNFQKKVENHMICTEPTEDDNFWHVFGFNTPENKKLIHRNLALTKNLKQINQKEHLLNSCLEENFKNSYCKGKTRKFYKRKFGKSQYSKSSIKCSNICEVI
ncbi:hypothetical protein SteCoe_13789 [Stentor coeruleus]|uniref:Uncharacterized protein n=1 Tax=Stentor coeruleus TaxID=5963 RepID=A0A1R2C7P9_9CILI|nr:hypothetical protein SteCoe_13789 [Stentor coeruleus]